MAQSKLRTISSIRQLMAMALLATQLALLSIGLSGCALAQSNDPVGMTLLFMNKGPYSIGVRRFDPDGLRGPTPGAVGVGGGKQMSFMPGDSKRGVPQFVEVEWSGGAEGLDEWWAKT
jgi:hypothetical protein